MQDRHNGNPMRCNNYGVLARRQGLHQRKLFGAILSEHAKIYENFSMLRQCQTHAFAGKKDHRGKKYFRCLPLIQAVGQK